MGIFLQFLIFTTILKFYYFSRKYNFLLEIYILKKKQFIFFIKQQKRYVVVKHTNVLL